MKKQKSNWEITNRNVKVVILDVDGVLNHQKFYDWRSKQMTAGKWKPVKGLDNFSPESIKYLNMLTDATGAKIVLSASMRFDGTIPQLQKLFKRAGVTGDIIGRTPFLQSITSPLMSKETSISTPRGIEIRWWLNEQGFKRISWSKSSQAEKLKKSRVTNYVILDDDSDMLLEQQEHFVKCNAYKDGFNEKCLQKAINILNMDVNKLYAKTQDWL